MGSRSLDQAVRQFLQSHVPFSQMEQGDLEHLVAHLQLAYFGRGEILVEPDSGIPEACFIIRQGMVEGLRSSAGTSSDREEVALTLGPGEPFPVGALLAARPVMTRYRAAGDVFCWLLPKAAFDDLLSRSSVFLDFCKRRMGALLDLSNQALQASYSAQATQLRSMSAPIGELLRRAPVTCRPDTPLRQVFEQMESLAVGAMLVSGPGPEGNDAVLGIFTRQDVIGRVVLPGVSLDTPIALVMSAPVLSLQASDTIADAMLLMAERVIRHVPVMSDGRLMGVVTERDLFVLQRRSLRQIGDAIRQAKSVAQLAIAADDIRQWSRSLIAQGVTSRFITRLIARLNDQLARQLVETTALERGLSLEGVCWLALGSEGREEQTIATDQDNGLLLAAARVDDRADLLSFAQEVNRRLDECGFPLCKGGVMAGNPAWCLSLDEWRHCFDTWIDRGDPESLLQANIFFDFRAIVGDATLAVQLREHLTPRAAANQRFLKQMSDNALKNGPPTGFTGGLAGMLSREETFIDLKLHGAAPITDAARLLALAHGVSATGTAARLQALSASGVLRADETEAWLEAFDFLQSLRLRVQHGLSASGAAGGGSAESAGSHPNSIATDSLSALDRKILREAFRQVRKLQSRLSVDYPG
jgi:CBS domain-containing protein